MGVGRDQFDSSILKGFSMLQITRRLGQSFKIGDDITITVIRDGKQVKLGIDAPKDVPVVRDDATKKERKEA